LTLSADELAVINRICNEKYGNPSWVFENSPKFSFHNSKRFPGGKVEVYLDVAQGAIASCSIRGDFLGAVPIRGLEEHFENKAFQYPAIRDALDGINLEHYLGGITKDQLLSCLFD
jgi:lipoate-protein ligase A